MKRSQEKIKWNSLESFNGFYVSCIFSKETCVKISLKKYLMDPKKT